MEDSNPPAPIKKKRGRKPKGYYDNLENQEKPPEPKEPTAPKKRGRKPKGGKIVIPEQNIAEQNYVQQNVILHLKCNLSDLDKHNNDNNMKPFENDNILSSNKTLDLNYEIIDNNNSKINFNNIINEDNNEDINNVNNNLSNPNINNCCSQKDINKKLKELQHNLHNNNISEKTSACFWCTYDFDNPSIYIPKYKINSNYYVYGCFCTPECALSYLMNENIDTTIKYERYQLLNYIYCKIYNYDKNIKPAPNPYYFLDKFYGNLTIQEYRQLLSNDRLLMVVDKPLTRIFPELHEESDNFFSNTDNNTNNNNSAYKVKKKNNNQSSKVSILNETFGM